MARAGRPLTFDQDVIDLIRKLANEGVRGTEIAKKVNRHYKAVNALMVRMGMKVQPRNKFLHRDKNPSWKGGRWVDQDGYVMIYCPDHPNKTYGCYVREHRLVMEEHLGRHLLPTEVVHHIDGNKQNNHISNLKLFARNSDHLREELKGRVPSWTKEGLEKMRESGRRGREKQLASKTRQRKAGDGKKS